MYEGLLHYPEYMRWHKEFGRISAPTSDEILKELPQEIRDAYELSIDRSEGLYYVYYWRWSPYDSEKESFGAGEFGRQEIKDKKLSNALAKIWLYLKKEGYIK